MAREMSEALMCWPPHRGPSASLAAAAATATTQTTEDADLERSALAAKRAAPRPSSSPGALLAGRLESLHCAPFDGGCQHDSPSLAPSQKRARAPSLRLPALADLPSNTPASGSSDVPMEHSSEQHWHHEGEVHALEAHAGGGKAAASSSSSSSDWRMVLYHDRHVVLYNPDEKPSFRSRRLPAEEAAQGSTDLSNAFGKCPLCRQTITARFAFAAQAYFDLLQGLFRSSGHREAAADTADTDEIDLLTEGDLYRILGISKKATPDDVKRAYRKRSLRYHPDKNLQDSDAKFKFQKVAEAFSVLSDENKRAKYDKSGDMDLEDFDVETFMDMVNATGLKNSKFQKPGDGDMDDLDMGSANLTRYDYLESDQVEAVEAIADCKNNPFLVAEEVPVVASEGGAEAEAAAAAELRNLPPGLLNTGYYSRFFVETKHLGSGSFGAVYLCRHMLDDLELGDYAVKKVAVGDNKVWLRDMIREVKTFERLHHPNIVEYKHSWLELDRRSPFCPLVPFLFILMQYCNGGSLEDLIWVDGDPSRPKAPMPATQIWHLLLDIIMGLQHLHRQGILHRDLKPTNILLTMPEEGLGNRARAGSSSESSPKALGLPRALLSDFGTSQTFGEAPNSAAPAASRGYTGTIEYTAPELIIDCDDREYSEKSDMWSLGIVLYAMCYNSLPFSHDDPSVCKGLIRSFMEERQNFEAELILRGITSPEADASWLPPDPGGRLGPLTLVVAALLSLDSNRRPSAADLLENPVFRGQAMRHLRRSSDQQALPLE